MRRMLVLALAGCGAPVPEDRLPDAAPEPARSEPERPVAPLARCEASDELGGSFNEWLPGDLRLALVIDLGSAELPAAIGTLQRGIQEGRGGLAVVAGLGLAQVGLQLGMLRPQLITAGLQPRELLLLHDRAGAVVWVLRARCDLAALQAQLADTWSLKVRTLSEGAVAEASGGRFAFDVAFLSADRIALVPPGMAPQLRRWLERGGPVAELGASVAAPGAVLDELEAAPIRGVLSGRSLTTSLAQGEGAGTLPLVRTLRASAAGLEIDGVMTGP